MSRTDELRKRVNLHEIVKFNFVLNLYYFIYSFIFTLYRSYCSAHFLYTLFHHFRIKFLQYILISWKTYFLIPDSIILHINFIGFSQF